MAPDDKAGKQQQAAGAAAAPASQSHSPATEESSQRAHPKSHTLRHFLITLLVLYGIETAFELATKPLAEGAVHDKLVEINQHIENSLKDLHPFALKDTFWDRLGGSRYSLAVWSFSEPFNATARDKNILQQLKQLRQQAPKLPVPPALSESALLHRPSEGELEKYQTATQQYDEAWRIFDTKYAEWEPQYKAAASKLTKFDSASYAQCMARTKGGGRGPLLLGNAPCFYDSYYYPYASQQQNWLLHSLLGLPDALFYALHKAFTQGWFQSFLAVLLAFLALVFTIAVCRKGNYGVLAFLLLMPLVTSATGWLLLGLVKLANFLLGWALAAPALPMVTGTVGFALYQLGRTALHMAQHEAASKISHGIEKQRT